jgi:hypothetical protein
MLERIIILPRFTKLVGGPVDAVAEIQESLSLTAGRIESALRGTATQPLARSGEEVPVLKAPTRGSL